MRKCWMLFGMLAMKTWMTNTPDPVPIAEESRFTTDQFPGMGGLSSAKESAKNRRPAKVACGVLGRKAQNYFLLYLSMCRE